MKRIRLAERELPGYTRGEETANMWTHIAGVVLGVVVLLLCFTRTTMRYGGYSAVGGAIFGSMVVLLYTMSSVYHGLRWGGTAKKVMQIIDHCTIFALIAGTYMPITLCGFRAYNPVLGWTMFGGVWAVAVAGIVLNAIDLRRYRHFSMICYILLGWCIVFVFPAALAVYGTTGLTYLIGGGVAYTVGSIFYKIGKKMPYAHAVFHVLTLLGTVLHAIFVLRFVI